MTYEAADRASILDNLKAEVASSLQIEVGGIAETDTLKGLGMDSLESSQLFFNLEDTYLLPEDFESRLPKGSEGEDRDALEYTLGELTEGIYGCQGTKT